MADRGGFEPPIGLTLCWFSRPVNNIQNIDIIVLSGIVGQSTVIIKSSKPSLVKSKQILIFNNIP